jgi:hypothetical protein
LVPASDSPRASENLLKDTGTTHFDTRHIRTTTNTVAALHRHHRLHAAVIERCQQQVAVFTSRILPPARGPCCGIARVVRPAQLLAPSGRTPQPTSVHRCPPTNGGQPHGLWSVSKQIPIVSSPSSLSSPLEPHRHVIVPPRPGCARRCKTGVQTIEAQDDTLGTGHNPGSMGAARAFCFAVLLDGCVDVRQTGKRGRKQPTRTVCLLLHIPTPPSEQTRIPAPVPCKRSTV